jgi:glycosyltransferase involved in cell wall biosynthesis
LPYVNVDAIIRRTGMNERVHIRSYVSDEQLQQLYADASAFAFLSEYEGFGLTPLEALASGVPVVLLDTAVAREICDDAARYVTRPHPLLIEQALAAVLFDGRERERILHAAKTVLSRFSWHECAARVLDVLVESGRRRVKRAGMGRSRSAPDAG